MSGGRLLGAAGETDGDGARDPRGLFGFLGMPTTSSGEVLPARANAARTIASRLGCRGLNAGPGVLEPGRLAFQVHHLASFALILGYGERVPELLVGDVVGQVVDLG